MAKTKAEIRDRALRMLGKLAIGQTAETDIADDIESAYDQVYDQLENLGLVVWASDSVPNDFAEPVAALVAMERSESASQERFQRIAVKASVAHKTIAALINGKWVNPRQSEDF